MLDSHCHLDLYPEPSAVADRAEAAGVFTIMVTNLPSAYERSRSHVGGRRRVRLALGFHPLLAEQHGSERDKFQKLMRDTSFIGEVGLDFSPEGRATANLQIESFEFVLRTLAHEPKFISIHSRGAEARVIELLRAAHRSPVVLHWYAGPIAVLEHAVSDGHYFSVNPAMIRSKRGQKVIAAIPQNRILTETDGPFVTLGKRPAEPTDIQVVEEGLAQIWKVAPVAARSVVGANFRELIAPLRH